MCSTRPGGCHACAARFLPMPVRELHLLCDVGYGGAGGEAKARRTTYAQI